MSQPFSISEDQKLSTRQLHSIGRQSSLQQFVSEDGQPLGGLPTRVSNSTKERYIRWKDIEQAFPKKSHIQDENDVRVLFMVDHEIFPLRIKHSTMAYTVVLDSITNINSDVFSSLTDIHPISPLYDQPPMEFFSLQGEIPEKIPGHAFLRSLPRAVSTTNTAYHNITTSYQTYACLLPILGVNRTAERHRFLTVLANLDYQHSVLRELLSKFSTQDLIEQSGIVLVQEGLSQLSQHVEQCELFNRLYGALRNVNLCLEFATPRLFIVLPDNVKNWNIQDSSTHKFRLYYLCDFNYNKESYESGRHLVTNGTQARHIHISSHQGYAIARPKEFFRRFTLYALTMLQLVKFGLLEREIIVPDLGSFRILSCFDGKTRHDLDAQSLGHRINTAIDYIKQLGPQYLVPKTWLDGEETQYLQTCLEIPPGDLGMGGLHKSAYKRYEIWMCPEHTSEQLNAHSLESFISMRGGQLDLAFNRAHFQVGSMAQATQLCGILKDTRRTFDISLRLAWPASRSELQEILGKIGSTGVGVLEIDGVTVEAHPRSAFHSGHDIFAQLISGSYVKFIALSHYPRRSDQYIYLGESGFFLYGLRFARACKKNDFAWLELRKRLDRVMEKFLVDDSQEKSVDLDELTKALAPYEGKDLTAIDIFDTEKNAMWQGSFMVENGVVKGLREAIYPTVLPQQMLEAGTVCRLLIQFEELYDQMVFHRLMDKNPSLQEIELQVPESRILRQVSSLIGQRINHVHPLQVRLFEMLSEVEGREVGVVLIKNPDNQSEDESTSVRNHSTTSDLILNRHTTPRITISDIQVLSWACDTICGSLSNKCASLLDLATQENQSSLARLTVDITSLTSRGIKSTTNVLLRSSLECLHIRCVPILPVFHMEISMLLQAVQWPTIKTLIVSGDNIDQWLQFWLKYGSLTSRPKGSAGPELHCLEVFDNGIADIPISHQGSLALHYFVYTGQLSVLILENVWLQDDRDWDLIIEALDVAVLEELVLCWSKIQGVDRITQLLGQDALQLRTRAPELYSAPIISDLRASLAMTAAMRTPASTFTSPISQSDQEYSEEDSGFQSPGESEPRSAPFYHERVSPPAEESYLFRPMDPNWNAPGVTPALAFVQLHSRNNSWVGPFDEQESGLATLSRNVSISRSEAPPDSRTRRSMAPQFIDPSSDLAHSSPPPVQLNTRPYLTAGHIVPEFLMDTRQSDAAHPLDPFSGPFSEGDMMPSTQPGINPMVPPVMHPLAPWAENSTMHSLGGHAMTQGPWAPGGGIIPPMMPPPLSMPPPTLMPPPNMMPNWVWSPMLQQWVWSPMTITQQWVWSPTIQQWVWSPVVQQMPGPLPMAPLPPPPKQEWSWEEFPPMEEMPGPPEGDPPAPVEIPVQALYVPATGQYYLGKVEIKTAKTKKKKKPGKHKDCSVM
ncbi:hypothetical protein BG004_007422 [Podila humilis]|nr:hypothetical protein BG004_007422 [Podila humilis]